MVMRNGVRTGWIATGGVLSVFVVLVVTLAVWSDLRLPHYYDFSYSGSYTSSLIDSRASKTTTTTVRSFTAPWVIVDATGRVGVRVVPGTAGRLTVQRKTTWPMVSHGISE